MRNTLAHPITPEEVQMVLQRRLEKETGSGRIGDMEPLILMRVMGFLKENEEALAAYLMENVP